MLPLLVALTILSVPLVLARVAAAKAQGARRPELAPLRVRVQRPQIERRRVR